MPNIQNRCPVSSLPQPMMVYCKRNEQTSQRNHHTGHIKTIEQYANHLFPFNFSIKSVSYNKFNFVNESNCEPVWSSKFLMSALFLIKNDL